MCVKLLKFNFLFVENLFRIDFYNVSVVVSTVD